MVSRPLLLAAAMLAAVATASAQKDGDAPIIRKGLLRAQATITPAVALSQGTLNVYMHGDMEFFLSRKVSLRGDGYYFLGAQGGSVMKHNHSVFFGPQYHFPIGRFDPYIGIQPGASVVQGDNSEWRLQNDNLPVELLKPTTTVIPNISASLGFNFFVWKYIHFQVMARYVHGRYAAPWGNVPLDDLRFTFGLGWNVNCIKAK